MGMFLSRVEVGLTFAVLIGAGVLSAAGFDWATFFLAKVYLFIYGVINFITENARGPSTSTIAKYKEGYTHNVPDGTKKTIYFVRHGQSEWNYMANRGIKGFLYFPVYAVKELFALFSVDSYFYDSPLSELGRIQGEKIAKCLKDADSDELKELKAFCEDESTLLISSNLRRAISTMLYGFLPVFQRKPLRLYGKLQEMTRNVDGIALAANAKTRPPCPHSEVKDLEALYRTLDVSQYEGAKPLVQFKKDGLRRIFGFANFLLSDKSPTIICGGHSIYFRTFFRIFYPDNTHECHKQKVANGGVVKFTFEVRDGKFVIEDIKPVVKGFDKKKK